MSYTHDLYNDRFFDVVFDGKQGGYFVEVGALEGMLCSQTYFLEKVRNWKGIVVEPNPKWWESLQEFRECHIVMNPISSVEHDVTFLQHLDKPEYSKIDDGLDNLPEGKVKKIPMRTKTLSKMFREYGAPSKIDVLAVDIEGKELEILDELFKNSDVQPNLIVLECGTTHEVINFFHDKPYVMVKNPFLNYLKIDRSTEMIVQFTENGFGYLDDTPYLGNILDLEEINWEYYFIHVDMLKINPRLKKLIVPTSYSNMDNLKF